MTKTKYPTAQSASAPGQAVMTLDLRGLLPVMLEDQLTISLPTIAIDDVLEPLMERLHDMELPFHIRADLMENITLSINRAVMLNHLSERVIK